MTSRISNSQIDSTHTEPLRVSDAATVTWDHTAQVVVVGFGGAGVVAAIAAREHGATVIAVDRFDGGGAIAYGGGVIYAGGTRYQHESGFADTPEEMLKYLNAEGMTVTQETLRRFCQGSSGDLDWLEKHGVRHGGNAFLEKTQFPPNPHYLYYTGNEKVPDFAEKARPAPRGHRTIADGFGGRVYYETLKKAALDMGVEFLQHSPVTRLIVDDSGAVIGVEVNELPRSCVSSHQHLYNVVSPWRSLNSVRAEKAIAKARDIERRHYRPRRIRASNGVILCTGSFVFNLEMLGRHRPDLANSYETLLRMGSIGDDGSGVSLGCSVGGTTALMDKMMFSRVISPPTIYPHGIMLNRAGRRFVNEAIYSTILGEAIADQPGGKAWLILSARQFRKALGEAFFPGSGMFMKFGVPALLNLFLGGTRRGRTLAALANELGIDPAAATNTVAQYNAAIRDGLPDQFRKAPDLVQPLPDGAFYAVNVSLDNRFLPTPLLTKGGLDVDENTGAVKRPGGGVVKGLYAAGRVAVGLCSGGYVSGLATADTVFGGRRAGGEAARH